MRYREVPKMQYNNHQFDNLWHRCNKFMVNQKFLKASDTIYGNDKRLQITFEFFSKPILWDFLPHKTVKDPIKIPVLQDYLFRKVFFYEILKRNEKKKELITPILIFWRKLTEYHFKLLPTLSAMCRLFSCTLYENISIYVSKKAYAMLCNFDM